MATSFDVFGRRAAKSDFHGATAARYSRLPLLVAALRRNSREIVPGSRATSRTISRTPLPWGVEKRDLLPLRERPLTAWTPAVEPDGEIRDGAWAAELTGGMLDGWPKGMRLIVRKERPHPGAQLRITDADGIRITCFATNTTGRPIAELELRHRQRARAEDRVRAARATGLRNPPLRDTAQNRVWLEIVQIALDLPAWMPMLALNDQARLWEPHRLRLRLFSPARQLVTTGRRRILRLAHHWPWTHVVTSALGRLDHLPNPV